MRRAILVAVFRLLPVMAGLIAGGAAHAADPEMARCLLARKASARLACFEMLARERNADALAAAPAEESSPAPAAASPAASGASRQRTDFGLSAAQREERAPTREHQLHLLTAVVAAIRAFGAGYWSILTEDGATWRITEARQAFRPPSAGDTIALQRASLGSYLLIFDHQPGIRAKRLD